MLLYKLPLIFPDVNVGLRPKNNAKVKCHRKERKTYILL